MLKAILARIENAVFPRAAVCAVCGDARKAGENCLCEDCVKRVEQLRVPPEACERCLTLTRRGEKCQCAGRFMRDIARVYAPFEYRDAAVKLITDFKFLSCGDTLPFLCDRLRDALKTRDFDCLVPVPLHRTRRRERGYNQALLLAEGLSERIHVPVADVLCRTRRTRPQTTLGAVARRENVRGAFACDADMTGKRVLLIDDVRTIGATSAACAETLRGRGAAHISVCVIAVVTRTDGGKA